MAQQKKTEKISNKEVQTELINNEEDILKNLKNASPDFDKPVKKLMNNKIALDKIEEALELESENKKPSKSPDPVAQDSTKPVDNVLKDKVLEVSSPKTPKVSTQKKMSVSPLQKHLIHSESLRIAQEKISVLEEELYKFRQKNESIVSAFEVLKEKNQVLRSKLEDMNFSIKETKNNFKEEREVLLSALEEAKTQIHDLRDKKQELEKRLSRNMQTIHSRESSLESRLEILKNDTRNLQETKDKKIIELQHQIQKIKANLEASHQKNQELKVLNDKLQESSRRTVSSLRATIYSLEGISGFKSEETLATETTLKKVK